MKRFSLPLVFVFLAMLPETSRSFVDPCIPVGSSCYPDTSCGYPCYSRQMIILSCDDGSIQYVSGGCCACA
jgi:hypothetical protein